jgi:dipeptidyl aminopeptidase/acylaminoacyl peptidase
MRMGVLRVDIGTGRSETLFDSDQWLSLRSGFDCVGQAVVYVAESSTSSPDLWITDDAFATRRRLTALNPSLEHREFGKARLVSWLGLHGDTLRGILILPAAYDPSKQYPLIVSLYGGSRPESLVNTFGLTGTSVAGPLNLQLFATRGYAILVPDAVFRAGGTLMFDLAASVLPGVNRLVELGVVDPDRIGVTGLSFGGYSALALAAQTPRIKAVVARSGFADFSTYAATALQPRDGHTAGFANSEHLFGMGGTVWERRPRYIENSPFYFLDRVAAAVLLVHGSGDETVSPVLADQTYSALRRLGKTVQYARYEGEGHAEGAWSYADASDELERIVEWFDRYLKDDLASKR